MKILQVSNRVPWPLNEGGTIGIYNYTKAFSELGHEVTLFCLDGLKHNTPIQAAKTELNKYATLYIHPIDTDVNYTDALKQVVYNKSYNVSRFYNQSFENQLINLLKIETYDIIQLEGTYVGPYIQAIRTVYDGFLSLRMHNVEHEIWERLAINEKNVFKKTYLNILARQLKKYESNILKEVDTIVTVTDEDANKFKSLHPDGKYKTVPAGINLDTWRFTPSATQRNWYHIGSMEWHANEEAIHWYVNEIHHLLTSQDKDFRLRLAGKGIDPDQFKPYPQLTVSPNVPDAFSFVKECDVCVVPLKSGSGIRLKILEAMAAGKLVISTTIGAQGIDYEKNKHLLIANTPQEFSHLYSKLQHGQIDVQSIIKQARQLIVNSYSTEALAENLLDYYQSSKAHT